MNIFMTVLAYEEHDDTFKVQFNSKGEQSWTHLPASAVAKLAREDGSPDEFLGRTFTL